MHPRNCVPSLCMCCPRHLPFIISLGVSVVHPCTNIEVLQSPPRFRPPVESGSKAHESKALGGWWFQLPRWLPESVLVAELLATICRDRPWSCSIWCFFVCIPAVRVLLHWSSALVWEPHDTTLDFLC